MLVEQNTVLVEEREREVRQIVQSISDLNEIFRDLAGMVVEQVRGKGLIWFYLFVIHHTPLLSRFLREPGSGLVL